MSGTKTCKPGILSWLMLIAAIGLSGALAAARTPSPQSAYAGPGRYEIENVASGKVLD